MSKWSYLILAAFAGIALWFRFFFQPTPPQVVQPGSGTNPKWKLVACVQSWCKDCIREVPSLMALQTYVGKDKLEVVLISDEDSAKRARFEELTDYAFPVQFSDRPFKLQGIFVYPTTWLLNPKGEKVMVHQEGYNWNSPEVVQLIQGIP
jgi:thiol-disulfide isomerase/thioredoxin